MQQEELSYPLERGENKTVVEARRELLESLTSGGSICPCCGANVKPYKVSITSKMLRELRWLVDESGAVDGASIYPQQAKFVDFASAPPDIRASRTISKLRFFGLVEKKMRLSSDGKESEVQGMWRPTTNGIKFSLNMIKIQTRSIVFRGEVISTVGPSEGARDVMLRGANEVYDEP